MAEPLGEELPTAVRDILDARNKSRGNAVISLLTSDASGFARVCLLSPYQVLSRGGRTLLIAVYNGTRTSRNLRRNRKATLMVVTPPSIHYVNGRATLDSPDDGHGNSIYSVRVREVSRDYSPKAPVSSQLTFEEDGVKAFYSEVYDGLHRLAAEEDP